MLADLLTAEKKVSKEEGVRPTQVEVHFVNLRNSRRQTGGESYLLELQRPNRK